VVSPRGSRQAWKDNKTMNLLCPSCQKMLQVPDQYAGQQMRCPLCNNIFTVPGLPEQPGMPAAPPPPPPAPYPGPAAPPPAPPLVPDPMAFKPTDAPTIAPPARSYAPAPSVQERDYLTLKSIWISKKVIPWIAPMAISLVFLLTFFPWISIGGKGAPTKDLPNFNAWSLAFGGDTGKFLSAFGVSIAGGLATIYILFTLFGFLAAIGAFLLHLGIIPPVPALQKWRAIIVGGFVWVALFFLFLSVLLNLFDHGMIWLNFWGLLAWWAHLVAAIALGLEAWLQLRGPEAPSPRIDLHL
jgi:hypothetical protein